VQQRGMVTAWDHPLAAGLRLVSSPMKLGETPVRTDLPPPLLGQHTHDVLLGLLGYDEERLAQLRRQGVV